MLENLENAKKWENRLPQPPRGCVKIGLSRGQKEPLHTEDLKFSNFHIIFCFVSSFQIVLLSEVVGNRRAEGLQNSQKSEFRRFFWGWSPCIPPNRQLWSDVLTKPKGMVPSN